jgi:tight adherence protein B
MDALLIWILIVGGGIVLGLVVAGFMTSSRAETSLVEERLGRYLREDAEVKPQKGEKSSPLGDRLNVVLEKSNWGEGLARELARADIKLKPAEYAALMVILAIGVAAVAWYIGGQSIILGLVGALVGSYIPRFYVGREKGKRLQRFNEQLADMLNLMVNGLRAGYSTMQAMEAVSKEMPTPISDEFRRVVQEMQLGIPMETALENLLRRIPSEDLDLVVTAVNVQREVGGNLAEILDTISYTIRERVRIKGEVRVLTSQVVYSGRFLSMMPVFIALILYVMNRPYMMMFFLEGNRVIGLIALGVAAVMVGFGYFVMTRIANIEI